MRRHGPVVCLLLCLLAVAARAGEPDPAERAWVAQCVRRLDAKSERVRAGAVAALQEFDCGVVEVMVAAAADLESEQAWVLFERVLVGYGPRASRDALVACRSIWPKARAERLQALLERLGAVKRMASEMDSPVEHQVRELLEPFRNTDTYMARDPRVIKITSLGRKAIPVLVRVLCEQPAGYGCFYDDAAADALAGLVTKEDLPVLAELLENGILIAAKCIAAIPGEEAKRALLTPVRKGFMSHELLEALKSYSDDDKVSAELLSYIGKVGVAGGWNTGAVAEHLGEIGYFPAVPVLKKILAMRADADVRRPVATALVQLGDREAIPVLISILASGARQSAGGEWQVHRAGEVLNGLAGRRIYVGSLGPDSQTGNYAEAAQAFREWWEENGDRLVYDREWRTWKVKRD